MSVAGLLALVIVVEGKGQPHRSAHAVLTSTAPPSSLTLKPTQTRVVPRPTAVRRHVIPPLVFHGRSRAIGDLFGLGSYIAQRYPRFATPALERARLTGADWLREEFTANKLHRRSRGRHHWRVFDRVVRAETRLGFHILGLLDYNNTWTGRPHSYMPHAMMPRLIRDFTRYVTVVVRHYRHQIRAWQIWNEPDLHLFWRPHPNATDYAHLLTAAYRAVKRANPHAIVVLGGPSGSDPRGLGFISRVVQAGGKFDVLSVQPYRDIPDLQLIGEVNAVRRYRKPIWFTEMGWAGEGWCVSVCGGESSQAGRLARLYVVAAFARVQRVFWYDLRDDGAAATFEDHFGLLEHGFASKPAFVAYQMSRYYLNRGIFLGVDRLGPEVYAFRIRNHGRTFVVLWNNRLTYYGLEIPWRSREKAQVLDWSGQEVANSGHGRVSVTVPPRSVLYVVSSGFAPQLYRPLAAPTLYAVPTPTPHRAVPAKHRPRHRHPVHMKRRRHKTPPPTAHKPSPRPPSPTPTSKPRLTPTRTPTMPVPTQTPTQPPTSTPTPMPTHSISSS